MGCLDLQIYEIVLKISKLFNPLEKKEVYETITFRLNYLKWRVMWHQKTWICMLKMFLMLKWWNEGKGNPSFGCVCLVDLFEVFLMIFVRVIGKVPQRGMKLWIWSFFEKIFYEELVSLSFIRAYFVSLVTFFEMSSFQLSNFERILGSKHGMRMDPLSYILQG